MSNLKIESYSVTISIPMRKPLISIQGMDIGETEELFIKLRNEALSHDAKVELDRARALVKFASCTRAELYAMEWRNGFMKFCFMFYSKIDQEFFLHNFKTNVEEATMI